MKITSIFLDSVLMKLNIEALVISDYLDTLEKELRTLRKRNRDLETAVEEGKKFGRIPHTKRVVNEEEVISEVKDNAIVRCHIQSLNDTIGNYIKEKLNSNALRQVKSCFLIFRRSGMKAPI